MVMRQLLLIVGVFFIAHGAIRTYVSGPANSGLSYTGSGSILATDSIYLNSGNSNYTLVAPLECGLFKAESSYTGNVDFDNHKFTTNGEFRITLKTGKGFYHSDTLYMPNASYFELNMNGSFNVGSQTVIAPSGLTSYIDFIEPGKRYIIPKIIKTGAGITHINWRSHDDTVDVVNSIVVNGTGFVNPDVFWQDWGGSNNVANITALINQVGAGAISFNDRASGTTRTGNYPRYNFSGTAQHPDTISTGYDGFYTEWTSGTGTHATFSFYHTVFIVNGYRFALGENMADTINSTSSKLVFADLYNLPSQGLNSRMGGNSFDTIVIDSTYRRVGNDCWTGEDTTRCNVFIFLAGCFDIGGLARGYDSNRPVLIDQTLVISAQPHDGGPVFQTYGSKFVMTGTNPLVRWTSYNFNKNDISLECMDGGVFELGTRRIGRLITHGGNYSFKSGDTLTIDDHHAGDFDGISANHSRWNSSTPGSKYYIKSKYEIPTVHYMDASDVCNLSNSIMVGGADCIDNGDNKNCYLGTSCACVEGK